VNYTNTFKRDKVSLLQITYNKFQHFLHLLRLENFPIILCVCQTSTPIIYILVIMTSQRDIINETTVSDVQWFWFSTVTVCLL